MWQLFGFAFSLVWLWWKSSFLLRLRGHASSREGAERIRLFLERMGGLWVKAGQLIALRRDLFLPETCDELSMLQDRARGFPWEYTRRAIEEDLGGPIEHFFSEFNQAPIAAASIGQTHEARLRKNGVRVAVKVQRPFVAQAFAQDFRYIRFVVSLLQRAGVAPQFRWEEMVREVESTLSDELDYRMEASSISRMRKSLRRHKVYVPKVFLGLCSRRVLVMEFIDGVFMSEYIKTTFDDPARLPRWLKENKIDPVRLGDRLLMSHLRQVNEDNLFHCDLHPGNIVVQRNNRFALIDFGSVGSLDKTFLQKYHMLEVAIAEGDDNRAADLITIISPPLPDGADVAAYKADIAHAIRGYRTLTNIKKGSYHEKSAMGLNNALTKVMRKYQFPAAWDLLRLGRARTTLDASMMYLTPHGNPLKTMRKYEQRAARRAMQASRKPKAIRQLMGSVSAAAKLPSMLAETLFFEGEVTRNRAVSFAGKITSAGRVINSVFSLVRYAVLTSCALVVVHYLHIGGNSPVLGDMGLGSRAVEAVTKNWPEVLVVATGITLYMLRGLGKLRRFAETKRYDRVGHSD